MTPVRYWEDVEIGDSYTTPARTITETDVVMFAGLTGDYMPFHVDEVTASRTIYGGRIAHGLLGLAYMQGMKTWVHTGIASMGSLGWTVDFRAPIRSGDTLTATFTVASKRETSKPDRGILFVACELRNQDGVLVQEAEHRRMVRRRPADGEPGAPEGGRG
ncbi:MULTISPECIES: MaoC/PaaZ C-terminal domain-containing protein [unclassified Nocardioides]|uniref:MaoC family dehydratase n=1 Tax=unclassified Nocardioides TaxID=2615069 RepID=UPI0000571890|nr:MULTISPECIES: MaoC/PaaZ C-terminal domain-containing protein [unclassified Nocardioides]ABL79581.1 MaoC domain protein dehydratase [Nocardioides sp. JS614]